MRLMIAIGVAAALLIPAAATSAGASPVPALHDDWTSDVSAAKKKKVVKRKPAPKEQYLRAVPSAPPPGTKQ
jgi:hypothetical protein